MKLVLAVVLLCVAYTVADDCDPLQRFKVKHQWAEAFGTGHHRVEFGVKVFRHFFKDHPEARKLFTRVNGANVFSPEFEAHAERVLGGLDMTIGLLDDQPALAAQLAHLKEQHKERKIPNEFYSFFAEELLDVLPDYLGTKLDFEAWTACTKKLVAAISS
jgi:hemoglobin-like flavoprotein